MKAFLYHLTYEFQSGLRSPERMLMNYLFPLGFYVLMGLIMTQVNPQFTQTMIPALVVFNAMTAAVLGLPSPLVEAREAGVFRSFKINGVPALSIVAIPTLTAMFHGLIASAIVSLTAPILFKATAPANWLAFAGVTVLTLFCLAGIGTLIGVVSQTSQATVLWSQLIFVPSNLLAGLMMPLSFLPAGARRFAALLPPAHAMQALLGYGFGAETVFDPLRAVVVLGAGGLLAFGLALYLFSWDSQNATRRGHPALALLAVLPYVAAVLLG
jgi:ABC-2 type transport system permease protein